MKFIIAVAASLPMGVITGLIVTAVANPSGDTEGIMKMTYGIWGGAIGAVAGLVGTLLYLRKQ
jgi:hypothetical protein